MIAWPTIVVRTHASLCRYAASELTDTDAEFLCLLFSADDVGRHIPPPPSSVTAWREWIARMRSRQDARGLATFAAMRRDCEDEIVGLVQIAPCPEDPTAIMWGLVIAKRFWGTGLFIETARVVIDIATTQLQARALKAWISTDNERAIRAFNKLPGVTAIRLHDTMCPDGRRGSFVIASIRLRPREAM